MFIVLAVSQMLGVGTTTLVSHAAGQQAITTARLLVFNQSQVLSMVVGVRVPRRRDGCCGTPYARGAERRCRRPRRWPSDYLLWFIPAMALQFGMVAMGAALRGTGNFKPGMVVQTATVIINIVLAPVLIFGWGTGVAAGRRRRGDRDARRRSRSASVWIVVLLLARRARICTFVPRDWQPQFALWRADAEDRPARRRRVRADGRLSVLVYVVSRPFGAAAQAGFGIGMRIVQACFLPVVALGFAVAPVAGQNFGARHGRSRQADVHDRRRRWRRRRCSCSRRRLQLGAGADGAACSRPIRRSIAVGEEYLHIVVVELRRLGHHLRVARACSRRWATRSRR